MVKLIELLINVVITNKRKMLVHSTTLEPKWYAVSCHALASGHTDIITVGEQTEPKSSDKLSTGNVVSP